ncbi:MAG: hypothetical protein ACRD6W_10700 [Nitrososphaerales archaeon]
MAAEVKWAASGRNGSVMLLGLALACVLLAFAPCVAAAGSSATPDQCGGTGPWCNPALSPSQRAQLLMNALSQSQKISLLSDDDPLGLTGLSGHTGSSAGVPGIVPR